MRYLENINSVTTPEGHIFNYAGSIKTFEHNGKTYAISSSTISSINLILNFMIEEGMYTKDEEILIYLHVSENTKGSADDFIAEYHFAKLVSFNRNETLGQVPVYEFDEYITLAPDEYREFLDGVNEAIEAEEKAERESIEEVETK